MRHMRRCWPVVHGSLRRLSFTTCRAVFASGSARGGPDVTLDHTHGSHSRESESRVGAWATTELSIGSGQRSLHRLRSRNGEANPGEKASDGACHGARGGPEGRLWSRRPTSRTLPLHTERVASEVGLPAHSRAPARVRPWCSGRARGEGSALHRGQKSESELGMTSKVRSGDSNPGLSVTDGAWRAARGGQKGDDRAVDRVDGTHPNRIPRGEARPVHGGGAAASGCRHGPRSEPEHDA